MSVEILNRAVVRERDPLQDLCGVIGAFSSDNFLFFNHGVTGLEKLETRGHDGAGVFATSTHGNIVLNFKGVGRVREVFTDKVIEEKRKTEAQMWIMQTRWGTNGDVNTPEASIQPVFREHEETGDFIVVAHNGEFETKDRNGPVSDTVLFTEKLAKSKGADWQERIVSTLMENPDADDAYSLIIGTPEGMFLVRDPHAYRPLSYGNYWDELVGDFVWVAASETHALSKMGIGEYTEVLPGQIVHFAKNKPPVTTQFAKPDPKLCLFENVYVARVNSRVHVPRSSSEEINQAQRVGEFRWRSGEILAREAPLTSEDVDFVTGIPGTAISGAKGFAAACELPYDQVIHDIDPEDHERTFLMADIANIYGEVLRGFSFDEDDIRGKKIALGDDSIVRNNVMRAVVRYLKELGAISVHGRVFCAPVENICTHGLNTRSRNELGAARILMEVGEDISDELLAEMMGKSIGLDSLAYLSLGGTIEAAVGDPNADCFCTECMRPTYVATTSVDFPNLDAKIRAT